MNYFSYCFTALLILLSLYSTQTYAAFATETTQWLNYGVLNKTLTQNIAQLKTMEQELANLRLNNQTLSTQAWQNASDDFNKLANLASQNQALSYAMSNINETFINRYPGFQKAGTYDADYQGWSNTAIDSLRGSIVSTQEQSQQLIQEMNRLNQYQMLSQSNQGRLQAMQLAHQIALEQITQMQKLRQLLMLQIQAQNTYMAAQEQKDALRRAQVQTLFTTQSSAVTENYTGFQGGSLDEVS